MKRRILAVAAAILVLGSVSSAQNQKEISVLGSILFKPALDKLIPGFESKTGYKVKFTWGSGVTARERVVKGAAEISLGPYFNDDLVPGVERIGALPRNVSTPTAIVGLIGIHAKDPAAAKALLDYLSSAEAHAVYKEIGMEPVP